MDIDQILSSWRRRPLSVVTVLAATAAVVAIVVAAGGPPSPYTHLFYFTVLVAAVLWGPWIGVAAGATGGVLAEPGARLLLGELGQIDPNWVLRALGMMLVGWACGSLTRSLLRRVDELETLNEQMIFAFVRAIDARDPYTARHSEKVADYAVRLAHAMGMSPAECERIRLTGLLHDVGKLALERSVLQKPGALTEDEWAQMKQHPALSEHFIGGVARFARFAPGVRHHHERLDGRGYPDGLKADAIPLDARILAVADAYDAMTSDRSYRSSLGREEAIRRLLEGAGTQFDPECVRVFVELDLHEAALDPIDEPMPAPLFEPVAVSPV